MSIFIIGPTGVGKTTLANRLAEKFGLQRVYKKLRATWHASAPGEWDNVRAACVVVRRNDQVLCIAREDGLGLGLPGGGVEAGERPDEAAARELREETGLEVVAADLELLYDGPSDDGLRVQTFLARTAFGEPRPSDEGLVFFGPAADLLTSAGAYPRYNAEVLRRLPDESGGPHKFKATRSPRNEEDYDVCEDCREPIWKHTA
jgi:8-oxo-dGTP pyrophosphatase MutT (NUDIX family)